MPTNSPGPVSPKTISVPLTVAADAATSDTALGVHNFCQTKIENLQQAQGGYEQVCRLNVAMNDALGMSVLQALRRLDGEFENFLGGQRLVLEPLLESLSFQQFHHNKGPALVFAYIVHSRDIGVVQTRSRPRLLQETIQQNGRVGLVVSQKFQGYVPAKTPVLSLIDHAHAASAQRFQYLVMRNKLSGREEFRGFSWQRVGAFHRHFASRELGIAKCIAIKIEQMETNPVLDLGFPDIVQPRAS